MTTRDQLIAGAREMLADAQVLLGSGGFANAYYLAGYAVEFGLKAVVARRFTADAIPNKALVNAVHTHDLSALLKLSGLELTTAGLQLNWARVVGWSEASRYDRASAEQAHNLIRAIAETDEGVFPWLIRHW